MKNIKIALLTLTAGALAFGCAFKMPSSTLDFKNGKATLQKDDTGAGLKTAYYNSNGVIISSLEMGSLASKNNPDSIDATGRVRLNDWNSLNQVLATLGQLAVKGAEAYATGGTSLLLPSGGGAAGIPPVITAPTTLPVVVPTVPTPIDAPTTLPAGAVVPPARFRFFSNEYWIPVATLTSGERPPVGWKLSPQTFGPFCLLGTTNCFLAIVPQ
jgi:hypothetical protein